MLRQRCVEPSCVCGDGRCVAGEFCIDGVCSCGLETPPINKKNYFCMGHSFFGADNAYTVSGYGWRGYDWEAKEGKEESPCEGGVLTREGCRCGIDKKPKEFNGYQCVMQHWECKSEDGCQCGKVLCPTNAICMDEKCICGETIILNPTKEKPLKCEYSPLGKFVPRYLQ